MEELEQHQYWMRQAILLAEETGNEGEIPVGAIVVDENNQLVAQANNHKQRNQDATAHAEILAIQKANEKLQQWRLDKCRLYVTLEPCPMCAGAIIQSRLHSLIYGVDDFKTGAIRSVINLPDSVASNHCLQVFAGIEEANCRHLIQSWFSHNLRQKIDNKKK